MKQQNENFNNNMQELLLLGVKAALLIEVKLVLFNFFHTNSPELVYTVLNFFDINIEVQYDRISTSSIQLKLKIGVEI